MDEKKTDIKSCKLSTCSETEMNDDLAQIEREMEYDEKYDIIQQKLQSIQETCEQHGSYLFENTTTLNFMLFLENDKENK